MNKRQRARRDFFLPNARFRLTIFFEKIIPAASRRVSAPRLSFIAQEAADRVLKVGHDPARVCRNPDDNDRLQEDE
jgi:hypothetical protein